MDENLFNQEKIQRVYQYLKQIKAKKNLDRFQFNPEVTDSNPDECLQLVLE